MIIFRLYLVFISWNTKASESLSLLVDGPQSRWWGDRFVDQLCGGTSSRQDSVHKETGVVVDGAWSPWDQGSPLHLLPSFVGSSCTLLSSCGVSRSSSCLPLPVEVSVRCTCSNPCPLPSNQLVWLSVFPSVSLFCSFFTHTSHGLFSRYPQHRDAFLYIVAVDTSFPFM